MSRTLALLLFLLSDVQQSAGRLLRTSEKRSLIAMQAAADSLLNCGYSSGDNGPAADKSFDVDRERYPFCHVLSTGTVALYWTHDGYNRERGNASTSLRAGDNVTFMVAVRTMSSWVALGLSRDGTGMKGMDVALLMREDADPPTFRLEDRYSDDYAVPELDAKQDKTLLWAKQASGVTTFAFTMPVHNCGDAEQDVSLTEDRFTHVIYAYGLPNAKTGSFGYHGQDNRGAATIPLLLSDAAELPRLTGNVELPPDAKTIDIRVNNVPLSTERTTNYWCVWVEVPAEVKYHVYDIQLISDPRTASMLHHVSLRDCKFAAPARPLNEPFESMELDDGCPVVATFDRNTTMPPSALLAKAGAAWPFGAEVSRYWRLEVHTENAALLPTNDSTGFRVTYSPTLRPHDLGTFTTGAMLTVPGYNLSSDLIIPAGREEYDYVNVCPSSCTKKLLPPTGVKVLNAHLHMHTHGQAGSVEVVRENGTRVSMISTTHFDAMNQPSDPLPTPIDLLPGDRVVTTCIYDTSKDTADVVWGPRKSQEMCLGTLYYYPAQVSSVCMNLQDVKHPAIDWLAKSDPSTHHALCVHGAVTEKTATRLDSAVVVPPEEQKWQEEGRGKATKLADLKAARRPDVCAA